MPSPFPGSPVIRECSWNKTQIEKKYKHIHVYNIGYSTRVHIHIYIYTKEAAETAAKMFVRKNLFLF